MILDNIVLCVIMLLWKEKKVHTPSLCTMVLSFDSTFFIER